MAVDKIKSLEEQLEVDRSTEEERKSLESQFLRDLEARNSRLLQSKFNFATSLIRSPHNRDITRGIKLLKELANDDHSLFRDAYYFAAVGHYRLSEYSEAKRYTEQLLQINPDNPQVIILHKLLEKKITRDGAMGLAIAGTLVAAVGVGLGLLAKKAFSR